MWSRLSRIRAARKTLFLAPINWFASTSWRMHQFCLNGHPLIDNRLPGGYRSVLMTSRKNLEIRSSMHTTAPTNTLFLKPTAWLCFNTWTAEILYYLNTALPVPFPLHIRVPRSYYIVIGFKISRYRYRSLYRYRSFHSSNFSMVCHRKTKFGSKAQQYGSVASKPYCIVTCCSSGVVNLVLSGMI